MSIQNEATRRPATDEYFEYYHAYVQHVPDGDLLSLCKMQIDELDEFFKGVSDADASIVHEPYNWTIKQVVGHLIDTEKIFGNRLHRFASGDFQELPGMDQNPYVDSQDYTLLDLKVLVQELLCCRQANLFYLQRIAPETWDNRGIASDQPITVRALAYILAGHINYHMEIVRKRLSA